MQHPDPTTKDIDDFSQMELYNSLYLENDRNLQSHLNLFTSKVYNAASYYDDACFEYNNGSNKSDNSDGKYMSVQCNRFFFTDILDFSNIGDIEYQEENKEEYAPLQVSLEVGMMFDDYDHAERFLNQYAKDKGFVIIKGRIEKDKEIQ